MQRSLFCGCSEAIALPLRWDERQSNHLELLYVPRFDHRDPFGIPSSSQVLSGLCQMHRHLGLRKSLLDLLAFASSMRSSCSDQATARRLLHQPARRWLALGPQLAGRAHSDPSAAEVQDQDMQRRNVLKIALCEFSLILNITPLVFNGALWRYQAVHQLFVGNVQGDSKEIQTLCLHGRSAHSAPPSVKGNKDTRPPATCDRLPARTGQWDAGNPKGKTSRNHPGAKDETTSGSGM